MLALNRGASLAAASERLGMDPSTVFRALQRLERGLGRRLFERTRSGYVANELALALIEPAEQVEMALETARSSLAEATDQVAGTVRLTTTDTILHGLLATLLGSLAQQHGQLQFELHTGNELASLTRRDADIAVRATSRPPEHLVGRALGPIRVALYGSAQWTRADVDAGRAPWVAPDDAMPEHPSVLWRKHRHPKVQPRYRVHSILTALELVTLGLGVGVLPLFLAEGRPELQPLTAPLDEAQTELWLLTHPESRHLRRVNTVFAHLAAHLRLP